MNDFQTFHVPMQYITAMNAAMAGGATRQRALELVGQELGFDATVCEVTENLPATINDEYSLTVRARPLPRAGERTPKSDELESAIEFQSLVSEVTSTVSEITDEFNETQASIAEWADATFGTQDSRRVALRASSEMHELVEAALFGDEADMIEEAADIIIVLMRVFHNRGVDYRDVIDRKMRKNRSRQWKLDGTGSGQHVG